MPPSASRQIQPHANSVKNCKNAADIVLFCSKKLSTDAHAYHQLFGAPGMPGDLSSYQGEIAFEVVATGFPRTKDGAPFAMTSLNGLVVRKKANDELMFEDMRSMIRILGPIYAETIWVPENPHHTQHPVILLSGLGSVRNTGRYRIEAGDIVLARLPPLGRGPQIPEDVRTPISHSRRVLETTPLRQIKNPFSNEELVTLAKNRAFQAMISDICQVALLYGVTMAIRALEVEDEGGGAFGPLDDENLNGMDNVLRPLLHPAAGAARDENEPLVPNPLIRTKDALKDVVSRICKVLCTPDVDGEPKPAPILNQIGVSSLNVAPYILSNVFAQIVGQASTGADPDNMFGMISTPTPQALMGRFRIDAVE